jgi:hypothetical protein
MVQANWSIAKRFLTEILAFGPEGWHAEEDERILLACIDEFSGELTMEIKLLEEEEDEG